MVGKKFKPASTTAVKKFVIASDVNGTLLNDNGSIKEDVLLFLAHMHRAGHTVGIFSNAPGDNQDNFEFLAMTKLPQILKANGFSKHDIENFITNVWLRDGEIAHKDWFNEVEGFEEGAHIVLEDENPNWATPHSLRIIPTSQSPQDLEFLSQFAADPNAGRRKIRSSLEKTAPLSNDVHLSVADLA